MKEQLAKIAAMISAAAHGTYPRVGLGTDAREAVDALAALGGERRVVVYDGTGNIAARKRPYVIESAEITIGGVCFEASFARDATPEEASHLVGAPEASKHSRAIALRGGS